MNLQYLTLGGGCFWCIEAAFSQMKGVVSATSGYMGGHLVNPTYRQICEGDTGHAEVVQVCYNPREIDTETLLLVFFSLHDPTQLNRQGHDIGTQYRSVLFYENPEQQLYFQQFLKQIASSYDNPVVTTLEPLATFYAAESYHQGYVAANPNQMYCQVVVKPKLLKFKQNYPQLIKAE